MTSFKPGDIYITEDRGLTFGDGVPRKPHKTRPFLILSTAKTNQNTEWLTVLGCPLSTQANLATWLCMFLPRGEGGVQDECWVRVPALQPIPKTLLVRKQGSLSASKLVEVQAQILTYLGMT